MNDRILVKNLLLRAILGVNEEERHHRQDVLINLVLETDTRAAGESDDLSDTVNYRTLTKHVIEMVEASRFLLVERMAEEIARLCLADERVQRLSQALQESIRGWRFEPVVAALQALRGIDLINAVCLVAEIGDFSRFEHPRQLMGYLGLVPSEHSSGERVRRGSITKTGNAHARRLLTEAAWNYRFSARISRRAQLRQEELNEQIRAMGWKAQLRLTKRFATLKARGVQINNCVAVARELAGFIWAIGSLAQQQAAAQRAS